MFKLPGYLRSSAFDVPAIVLALRGGALEADALAKNSATSG